MLHLSTPSSSPRHSSSFISVRHLDGRVLLEGPLHGKVDPSATTWALADYGIADTYKYKAYQCLQISFVKAAMYRDIWATVLNRDYVLSLMTPEELAQRHAAMNRFERPRNASMSSASKPGDNRLPPTMPTPPPKTTQRGPTSPTALKLRDDEELGYIDYELDEHDNVISQTSHRGNGEDNPL